MVAYTRIAPRGVGHQSIQCLEWNCSRRGEITSDRVQMSKENDPDRGLCFREQLAEGMEIEVQWTMSSHIAFSWWYGEIHRLEEEPDQPGRKWVSFTFYQYPEDSIWASGRMLYPNPEKEGDARGIYGGIRPLKRDNELAFWRKRKQLQDF